MRTGLLSLCLLTSLTACGTKPRIGFPVPAALTLDCEETRATLVDAYEAAKDDGGALPTVTNADLARKIRSLRADLARCSADKQAIRELRDKHDRD